MIGDGEGMSELMDWGIRGARVSNQEDDDELFLIRVVERMIGGMIGDDVFVEKESIKESESDVKSENVESESEEKSESESEGFGKPEIKSVKEEKVFEKIDPITETPCENCLKPCMDCLEKDKQFQELKKYTNNVKFDLNDVKEAYDTLSRSIKMIQMESIENDKATKFFKETVMEKQMEINIHLDTIASLKKELELMRIETERVDKKLISYISSSYVIDQIVPQQTDAKPAFNNVPPPILCQGKNKIITSFFKRKNEEQIEGIDDENHDIKRQKALTSELVNEPINEADQNNQHEYDVPQNRQENINEVDVSSLERDPAKRLEMWKYPVNIREQVRLSYISLRVYQIKLEEYKSRGPKNNLRRFKYAWLVNDGDKCPLLMHVKSSKHKKAFVFYSNLLNQEAHLENFIEKQSEEQIRKNCLRLKTTIDVVRWLTYQACALRGHDESPTSKNQGNFHELLKRLAYYNDDVAKVILKNAPYNSKYISSDIQQEILSIMENKVRKHIRSELRDAWFCVMVDESRDESKTSIWR
ncbi:uncharacterized protein LOC110901365 [Helianthus annuus]|uniref:uncharacterized protein LOC110901365 n=1 Tax=Helianthus annuus TaxID=4232 RepID=UPI000B8FD6D8|nr:uncharacterized protein LOC110901365 [Helianthus annuus]